MHIVMHYLGASTPRVPQNTGGLSVCAGEHRFVRQYMSTQWQHAAATSVHAPGQPRPSRKISAGRSQLHVQRRAGIPREYELLPPAPVIHHPPSKVLGIEGWWASAAEVERWVQAIARVRRAPPVLRTADI
jgi:hypothetical protein